MKRSLCAKVFGALMLLGAESRSGAESVRTLWLSADVDDDDTDGRMDGRQPLVGTLLRSCPVVAQMASLRLLTDQSQGIFRLAINGRAANDPLPRRAKGELRAQGLAAGRGSVTWGDGSIAVVVVQGWVIGDDGAPINLVASQGSLSRVPPTEFDDQEASAQGDGLRWVVTVPSGTTDPRLDLVSVSVQGVEMDRLRGLRLASQSCPGPVPSGFECYSTRRIHLVGGHADWEHRAARGRALRAEIGGRVFGAFRGLDLGALRVGAPRALALGGVGRWRANLRVLLVRDTPGGSLPLGRNVEEARGWVLPELQAINEIWGQCGISIGEPESVPILVVNPPAPQRVTFGCGLGLPATGGGMIGVRVGGRVLRIATRASSSAVSTAFDFAREAERVGYVADVLRIPTQNIGAQAVADVRFRSRDGAPMVLMPLPDAPLSTDGTLGVCLGLVDLSDGLSHFTDPLAGQGTIEERSLLSAFEDGDATTIEVFVVSEFSESSRLGESFIRADGSTPSNKVVVDAAGLASGARSHVLAHELGHLLLDVGGHPDDFGTDTSRALMDSDATGSGVFGPLRLSVEECRQAYRQSGSDGGAGVLKPWPLYRKAPGQP